MSVRLYLFQIQILTEELFFREPLSFLRLNTFFAYIPPPLLLLLVSLAKVSLSNPFQDFLSLSLILKEILKDFVLLQLDEPFLVLQLLYGCP